MNNTINDVEVAKEILRQLGGSKFMAMTGAHGLVSMPNALGLRLPRRNNINYIRISLNELDTYNVQFMNISKYKHRTLWDIKGVYVDMLKSVIEDKTGLYLSL
jgi:hypothetical protein